MASTDTTPLPPIVCAVDDGYVPGLCVLMQSLATAHRDPGRLRLIVMHDDLADEGRRRIAFHADRLRLPTDLRAIRLPAAEHYPISDWITAAAYLRLKVEDLLPDEDTAVYLDTDLLIRHDLGELMRTDVGAVAMAAVRDPQTPLLRLGDALPGWQELGLPPDREYFNSGVMVMNLRVWRERGIFARCDEFLRGHAQHVRFWDQDALNYVVDDDWVRLDRRWNTFALSPRAERRPIRHPGEPVVPLRVLLAEEPDAAVLHFAGRRKPWQPDFPESRLGRLYRTYLDTVRDAEAAASIT